MSKRKQNVEVVPTTNAGSFYNIRCFRGEAFPHVDLCLDPHLVNTIQFLAILSNKKVIIINP